MNRNAKKLKQPMEQLHAQLFVRTAHIAHDIENRAIREEASVTMDSIHWGVGVYPRFARMATQIVCHAAPSERKNNNELLQCLFVTVVE